MNKEEINNNEIEELNALHELIERVMKDVNETLQMKRLGMGIAAVQRIIVRLLALHKGLIRNADDISPSLARRSQQAILTFFSVYAFSPFESVDEVKKSIVEIVEKLCDGDVLQVCTERKADEACKQDSLDEE